MKPMLYYLLQVIIASGILYGYYHLALRNKRFHQYNRFYLLAAFIISILVPFLNIPVYFTSSATDSSFILQSLTIISSPGSNEVASPLIHPVAAEASWFTWQNLSYLFYILIAITALVRMLLSLKRISSLIRNNPVEKLGNIHFVNTDEPGTPFSFFRWLFWNRRIELQSEKGGQVFRHELYHIEQKHSGDIIFMELVMVVFWINPFFHLIKKEVKAIHEFLADKFAVKENKHWEYAELLLMQAFGTKHQLVNPFFHNQIKRRIAMLTSYKRPKYQYLNKILVLPVSALVILLFAFSYKTKHDAIIKQHSTETQIPPDTTNPENKVLVSGTINMQPDANDTNTFLLKGNVTVTFEDKYGKTVYLTAPVITGQGFAIKDTSKPLSGNILFIIDGKESPEIGSFTAIDNQINPADINSINVLKGPAAIARYGDKGKNGVIEIITKKGNMKITETTLTDSKANDTTNPRQSDNMIFVRVEIEPSFPGGEQKWHQYLERNLYPSIPVTKKAPDGAYTVIIQFIVDIEGNITDVKPLTKHGYGMEEEALRVIKKGPKWVPAVQNGHQVKAYKVQPITFQVGKAQTNDKTSFVKVETPPSFPGGDSAWKRYLIKNINATTPVDSGAPAGNYKVIVQFIVHEDGSISDIKAITHYGYGMEDEVMRLMKKGPKWIPGTQNGKIIKAFAQQPVTFVVAEEDDIPATPGQKMAPETEKNVVNQVPKISIADLRKASVYKILQVSEGTPIVSFTFTIDLENGDLTETYNTGDQFSTSTKMQINNARPGRIFTIDNIRITIDGKERRIPSKIYEITD